MSELTYIYTIQVKNYATIDDLKVAIIKTLARWFPNHYVFNEHAVESWVKKEETDIDVLYSNTFQFELSVKSENVYYLVMYAIGRYRRHGSSCDFFEKVLDCLEYQLGQPDIEFVTMQTARTNQQQDEQTYYPETSLWPTHSINESPLPIAGALAETVVYDEAEDVESLEDASLEDECVRCAGWGCSTCNRDTGYTRSQVDAIEVEDLEEEDEDEDDESDDESSDDEDELIMSMPLRDMNDTQIDRYIDISGKYPRDECDEWALDFKGGAILRYSYVNFADAWISNQHVSNITIRRAKFSDCVLKNYVFEDVHFDECDFKSVTLENVTFKNCQFTDCDLEPNVTDFLDNSCSVEKYDVEEDLEDNVTYRYC